MSFTGKSPGNTYKDILYVNNNNTGVDSTARIVNSGDGTASALSVSDRSLYVTPNTDNTTTLSVRNSDGRTKFVVDTTNDTVKALGQYVNTQYAYFGQNVTSTAAHAAGYHYPLQFGHGTVPIIADAPNGFGNGSDPALTLTMSDAADARASEYVAYFWYVNDNITIDSVKSLEGADAATGDTNRYHLMSYTFASGNTTPLSAGGIVARTADITNAGCEQPYLTTFSLENADVDAGQVVMAFFENDTINSDYSCQVIVKYHLR